MKSKKIKNLKIIFIFILIILVIIGVITILITKNKVNNKKINIDNNKEEKITILLKDGTLLNASEKIKETKVVNGLKIINIKLTEKNSKSVIIADVVNNTDEKQGGYPIKIKMLNKNNIEMITIESSIGVLEPGQTKQLNILSEAKFANAYDIEIYQKEQ